MSGMENKYERRVPWWPLIQLIIPYLIWQVPFIPIIMFLDYPFYYVVRYLLWTFAQSTPAPLPVFVVLVVAFFTCVRLYHASSIPKPTCYPGNPQRKKCVVIGSGVSGLSSAKELLAEGHIVKIFESACELGGVWAPMHSSNSRCWGGVSISTSSFNTSFSDYILPDYFPNQKNPHYATQYQFSDYIQGYAKQFNLREHIQFDSEVVKLEKSKGDRYKLMVKRKGVEELEMHEADYVVVACGLNHYPLELNLPNQHLYKGEIIHSSQYRMNKYKGRKILVIGGSESASDVIGDICDNLKEECTMSVHSNTYVFWRDYSGKPPDYHECRPTISIPGWMRWIRIWYLTQICVPFYPYIVIHTRGHKTKDISWHRKLMSFGKRDKTWLSFMSDAATSKSDDFIRALEEGDCQIKPEVVGFTENGVEFDDGTSGEFDLVINAGGYKPNFPFLNDDVNPISPYVLYKGQFHPLFPNLAFVGYVRGQVGSMVIIAEMQARWVALVASEKRKLPEKKVMYDTIKKWRENIGGRFPTRVSMAWMNHLARYEVGCEPNTFKYLFKDPYLYFKMHATCLTSYMYRLEGPHANPSVVKKAYTDVAIHHWDEPTELLGSITMSITGALCSFYSRIPYIGEKLWFLHPQLDDPW